MFEEKNRKSSCAQYCQIANYLQFLWFDSTTMISYSHSCATEQPKKIKHSKESLFQESSQNKHISTICFYLFLSLRHRTSKSHGLGCHHDLVRTSHLKTRKISRPPKMGRGPTNNNRFQKQKTYPSNRHRFGTTSYMFLLSSHPWRYKYRTRNEVVKQLMTSHFWRGKVGEKWTHVDNGMNPTDPCQIYAKISHV